jgi:hypothetical protein
LGDPFARFPCLAAVRAPGAGQSEARDYLSGSVGLSLPLTRKTCHGALPRISRRPKLRETIAALLTKWYTARVLGGGGIAALPTVELPDACAESLEATTRAGRPGIPLRALAGSSAARSRPPREDYPKSGM